MDSLSTNNKGFIFRETLIGILVLIFIKWIWGKRHVIKLSQEIKGPSFFKSLYMGLQFSITKNSVKIITDNYKKYLGVYRFWVFHDVHVIVFEPEDVKEVLFNSDSKPLLVAGPWAEAMGNGLVSMTNKNEDDRMMWKTHRNLLVSSLTPNCVKLHFPRMQKTCEMLANDVQKICDKGLVDIGIVIMRASADVVVQCLFDVKLDFRNGTWDHSIEAMEKIGLNIYDRAVSPWYWYKPMYRLTNAYKVQQESTNNVFKIAKEVYKTKMQDCREENTDEFQGQRCIDVLLKAKMGNTLTEAKVLNEIIHLWAAAFDTTGNSLSHIIQLLAMNKNCQDKAYQEIQNFFKNNDSIEWDDLDKFTYIDMCMKEALRLFPIGPTYYRYATKEFKLKSNNVTIPPGTHVLTVNFVTMRDPKYWKEPLIFNPERFSPEEVAKRHPFSFIPFGGGLRKCIGTLYGKVLMKLHIINLLKNFEVHSDWKLEELPLRFDFDCRSVWGHYVKVTPRVK